MQIVADNIQFVMEQRGLTAASLARKAEVNPTGIYDIISGKSKSPRLDTISKVASALNVPVVLLLERAEESALRSQIVETFQMLPTRERERLLQAARAWLPDEIDAQTNS